MSQQIDPERLRKWRDKAIRYINWHGGHKPKGEIPIIDLKRQLGITDTEYESLFLLLHNQGLAKTNGMDDRIALTPNGRDEAERLERALPEQAPVSIIAHHGGIVQYSGANNSQIAHLAVGEVSRILDRIEKAAALFNMQPADKSYLL